MPDTIIEPNRIVVEDVGGTKIELRRLGEYACRMILSGQPRNGARRINVKKIVQINELLAIREGLIEITEWESFQLRCYPEDERRDVLTGRIFPFGKFETVFQNGNCHIRVLNSIGTRHMLLFDPDSFHRELARALLESEEWFA